MSFGEVLRARPDLVWIPEWIDSCRERLPRGGECSLETELSMRPPGSGRRLNIHVGLPKNRLTEIWLSDRQTGQVAPSECLRRYATALDDLTRAHGPFSGRRIRPNELRDGWRADQRRSQAGNAYVVARSTYDTQFSVEELRSHRPPHIPLDFTDDLDLWRAAHIRVYANFMPHETDNSCFVTVAYVSEPAAHAYAHPPERERPEF